MTLSMYQAAVPAFVRMLTNLAAIVEQADRFAAERRIEPAVLLAYRLAPDMFPLVRQVQIATDFAKGATARLAGVTVPSHPDDEQNFVDLKNRITRTLTFVRDFQPADIDGSEQRPITLSVGGKTLHFAGQAYLIDYVLPNFYFHASMTYAILRHCGLPLGKRDFIGTI